MGLCVESIALRKEMAFCFVSRGHVYVSVFWFLCVGLGDYVEGLAQWATSRQNAHPFLQECLLAPSGTPD